MDTIEWAIAHQDDRVPWSNLSKDRLDRLIFVLGDMRLAPGGSDGSCDDFAIEALFGRDLVETEDELGAKVWAVFCLVPTGRAGIEDEITAEEYEAGRT